ncbi:MAG: imidazole glycerol phosphate synthase subunit HisH [Actinomycetota bacterium]
MTQPVIAVIDYGIGNLRSAEKALQRVGANACSTSDPEVIDGARAVVLPGVGAFGACMTALRNHGLDDAVRRAVEDGRPFLGICVGMQMLFETSEEDPEAAGLGVIPGVVRRIPDGVKHPQMQWNRLNVLQPSDPAFAGRHFAVKTSDPWAYFVHSFHGVPDDPSTVAATCEYGTTLNAAFRRRNVFATQFHPEKSGATGLALLENFVSSVSGRGPQWA